MALRTAATTKINTDLADGTSITAAEHRDVEKTIVDYIAPYNVGYVTLGNIPITATTYSGGGDLVGGTAVCSVVADGILCTIPNAMPSTDYLVRFHIQSLGTISNDSTIGIPVFYVVSTTQFRFSISETAGVTQNIRVWFETIRLS
jgi:hypothetical protein